MTLLRPNGGPWTAGDAASRPRGPGDRWGDVPWRTIVATVAIVLVTYAGLRLLASVSRIVVLVVVAGFIAVVLAPAVAWAQRHVGGRRALATAIVMFSSLLLVLGIIAIFVMPVRHQAISAATDLPGTIDATVEGNGAFGRAVERLHLQQFVRDHQEDIERWVDDLQGSSVSIARSVLGALVTTITVFVLTFLFLSQSSAISSTVMRLVPERRRSAVRKAGRDASHAISGYMAGNLAISLVAGVTALICLLALGVPNPIVLALFVAFADLVPLIGATVGAALGVFAAFLHSPTAGIVALVFFVVYQQFENNVLQPIVMSRTVKVNPLVVILSVLVGVELFGILGALLAIPAAGAIQVAMRAGWHEYYESRLRIDDAPPRPVDETT